MRRLEADAQQAQVTHLAQHATRGLALLLPQVGVGQHLLGDKAAHGVAQHAVLGREVRVGVGQGIGVHGLNLTNSC